MNRVGQFYRFSWKLSSIHLYFNAFDIYCFLEQNTVLGNGGIVRKPSGTFTSEVSHDAMYFVLLLACFFAMSSSSWK
jgi:hypothetical protein